MISLKENQMKTLEDNEFDIYTLGFWSEKKVSTIEAIEQISKNLKKSFEDSKPSEVDKNFIISGAVHTEENEIEVKVKANKGSLPLKLAVKKIETRYLPGDPYEITF